MLSVPGKGILDSGSGTQSMLSVPGKGILDSGSGTQSMLSVPGKGIPDIYLLFYQCLMLNFKSKKIKYVFVDDVYVWYLQICVKTMVYIINYYYRPFMHLFFLFSKKTMFVQYFTENVLPQIIHQLENVE